MGSSSVAVSENSTTGRLNPLPIPGWIRTSFKVTASVAPGLAAAWADRLFFTRRRAALRPKEAEVLAAAEVFELRVGGRKVRGWVWSGAGAPVLLVHGWGGHTGQMTILASALRAAGHRVVGIDMPGHGESEGDQSSLIYFEQALHAAATLFFGSFAGVIGHSFGCAGVIARAMQGPFPPERAVFFAPPVRFQTFWDRFCDGVGHSGASLGEGHRQLAKAVGDPLVGDEPRGPGTPHERATADSPRPRRWRDRLRGWFRIGEALAWCGVGHHLGSGAQPHSSRPSRRGPRGGVHWLSASVARLIAALRQVARRFAM